MLSHKTKTKLHESVLTLGRQVLLNSHRNPHISILVIPVVIATTTFLRVTPFWLVNWARTE